MFFGMLAPGKIGLTGLQGLFMLLWLVLKRFQIGQRGDGAFADDILRGALRGVDPLLGWFFLSGIIPSLGRIVPALRGIISSLTGIISSLPGVIPSLGGAVLLLL